MGAAALFIRRTDAPDWNNAFINFDYKDLFVAPNYLVTELWYDHYSPLRLAYTGDSKELSVAASLAENGGSVIVKAVNPTDRSCTLTLTGTWGPLSGAEYEFFAPGSLSAANDMQHKRAVARQKRTLSPVDDSVTLTLDPLSAGVVTLFRK